MWLVLHGATAEGALRHDTERTAAAQHGHGMLGPSGGPANIGPIGTTPTPMEIRQDLGASKRGAAQQPEE